jgi:hypothetical protein
MVYVLERENLVVRDVSVEVDMHAACLTDIHDKTLGSFVFRHYYESETQIM